MGEGFVIVFFWGGGFFSGGSGWRFVNKCERERRRNPNPRVLIRMLMVEIAYPEMNRFRNEKAAARFAENLSWSYYGDFWRQFQLGTAGGEKKNSVWHIYRFKTRVLGMSHPRQNSLRTRLLRKW